MKRFNLLKEGHGLRYSPSPESPGESNAPAQKGRALRIRTIGVGKTLAIIIGLGLIATGVWLALKSVGPLGPRLAAFRRPAAPSTTAKPQAAPPPAAGGETRPAAKAAEPPPTAASAATSPKAPGALTASKLPRWFHADKAYPYAVVVASFRNEESARDYTRRLRKEGYPATVAPTDLGERGRWFRVVLERYEGAVEARSAAAALKGKRPLESAWAARLPFAVEVATEAEKPSAEARRDALAEKGAFAVLFPEARGAGEPVTFRLLAGAFPSKEQAEAFASTLKQAGVTGRIVTP